MDEVGVIPGESGKKTMILKKYNRLLENNIIAMVPVRAGSTRVPNKNIRKFADTNLLELKLKVLKKVNGINQIIVSTDCDIAAVSKLMLSLIVKGRWRILVCL